MPSSRICNLIPQQRLATRINRWISIDKFWLCTYLQSSCGASWIPCLAISSSENHQAFLSPPIHLPCLPPVGQWKWPWFYARTSHSQRGPRRQLSETTCIIQWFCYCLQVNVRFSICSEVKAYVVFYYSTWIRKFLRRLVPWSANSIQKGDDGWDIHRTPPWYLNLRN